jgi:hypothetical protein
LPPAVTHKRRPPMEPISYDELMSNAGMSGFVSFLEHPSPAQAPQTLAAEAEAVAGTVGAPAAIPQPGGTRDVRSADDRFSSPVFPRRSPVPLGKADDEKRSSVPPGRQGRIRKATMAEDGHSLAEQAVYEVLWQEASPVGDLADTDRTIRIGYHRLAQMTRLSWVSVKANLRTLERKLAIEVTGSENSSTREGKCYLVYSRSSIMERRKRAGLEWVRRTRGVELLSQAAIALGRPGPKPVA